MQKILGISAYYHDSAAALIIGDKIVAAAQEERFTRIKHTPDFPTNAIKYCLEETGLTIDELDAIVFYDKPLLKFERLLETYYAFSPQGLVSFLKAIPVWTKEKLFMRKMIRDGLKDIENHDSKKLKLLFPEHHLSHAASAFYPSPYETSAILTIDGVGEWSTASIAIGEGNKIKMLRELHFPHSLGLLYSAFTYFLGFKVNSGEYKLMGLAPYGNSEAVETKQYLQTIRTHLLDIKEDGSIWLNPNYFTYTTSLRMVNDRKWQALFGFACRLPEEAIEAHHTNLAFAIQTITEEIVIKMATEAKRLTGSENLCMAGGVALNCVANTKLQQAGIFKNIFIQPAAGDAGGALGAALAAYYGYFHAERSSFQTADSLSGAYLGPSFSDKEVETMAKEAKAIYHKHASYESLNEETVKLLAQGKVIGWFQGRMEFGPRALGNRSILADARSPEMQKKLNLNIKYREGFRPFAPAVLAEDADQYFDLPTASPYMLFVAPVKEFRRKPLPSDYQSLSLWDKLYHQRSDIPAVTHLDFSARVQTVHKETNPLFWNLLNAFKQQTNYGILINTSFNVRGEPIVCTPWDAYRCFMATEMDYLVINQFIFDKKEQPLGGNWKIDLQSD